MANAGFPDNPFAEFEAGESAVRYYCRNMPAVFARASNARVWDENGNQYIDFLSGCGSLNYGHNHPLMKDRVIEYLADDGLVSALDLHTSAKREFIRAFRETILAPRGLDYRIQFTGPTGANAVEAALKLARKITGRRTVVAFTNAFHGMSLGALAAGGRQSHQSSPGLELNGIVRLPYDGYHNAGLAELDRYEAMVRDPSGGAELPAAFIVETIQGEGGLNEASPVWLRHLSELAGRLGSLLIVDDIQAGCGRTGEFFSFEKSGIFPDLVCLAKSISGIGLPMAVLLIKPGHDRWAPGEHSGTFRGNNLAFVAASVAIELWRDTRFLSSMAEASERVQQWIDAVCKDIGAASIKRKGRGLFSGLSFADPEMSRRIADVAFDNGLLIETAGPYGEVVKIMPPLTIEREVLDEGLRRLCDAVKMIVTGDRLRSAA